jgi:parallel beta-helix repeat protein
MQAKRLLWIVALGLGLALLGLLQTARAAPDDLFAKPDGSGIACTQANPCPLQTALGRAVDGDTIYAAGGTYTGTGAAVITITKSITLYSGWDGAPSGAVVRDPDTYVTTLDGENGRRGAYISGDITVTLDGFTITGGDATGLGDDIPDAGGGVYVVTATITLLNNWVYSNTAPVFGGGLYLHESDATLTGNMIYSNTSQGGGGLFLYYGDAVLSGNLIYNNTASGGGGGLFLYNNNATLSGNVISGNDAASGGGGLGVFAGDVVLTNNVVVDNQAGVNGSGIYMEAAQSRLSHTTIARNTGGNGRGVYITEFDPGGSPYYSTVAMTNTILVSHTVGIYATAGNVAILNRVLWHGNTANTGGAGAINVINETTGTPAFAPDGYHIGPGSAAIDAGVDAGVTTDIDGDARPIGPAPDIGADEARLQVFLPLVLRNS